MKKLLALFALLFCVNAHAAWPWTYCADGTNGSDANDGLACTSGGGHGPWLTIGRHNGTAQFNPLSGLNAVGPGDTFEIVASATPYDNIFLSGIQGSFLFPVLYEGIAGPRGARPFIKTTTSRGGVVQISSNVTYLALSNIDVTNGASAPTNINTTCVLIGSSGSPNTVAYITIDHVHAFGCGGAGIGSTYADHITITNNRVHDNGATITNASDSGISIYSPCIYDTAAGYHFIIQNNIVYNQSAGNSGTPSDGNGIILDDWNNDQQTFCGAGHPTFPYPGLVQGNLTFNNAGRGVHFYNSRTTSGTTIIDHNTSWGDCAGGLNTPCGSTSGSYDSLGFGGQAAYGVTFSNNIIVGPYYGISVTAATGGTVTACGNNNDGAGGSTHWDSTGTFTSTNSIATDPLLQNPQASAAGADFRPTASSPKTAYNIQVGC